jgi:hypothetical protein
MDTPRDAYEEAIEKMAESMWQAENVRIMGKPRMCLWAEAGAHTNMHWRVSASAAAEAIGLRQMMIHAENWVNSFKGSAQ